MSMGGGTLVVSEQTEHSARLTIQSENRDIATMLVAVMEIEYEVQDVSVSERSE